MEADPFYPKFVSVSIANRVHVREDSEATSCRKASEFEFEIAQ